jgi:hypothetical protein
MGINIKGMVGKRSLGQGASDMVRMAREGELLVSENHGRYYQKNSEGDAFVLSTPLAGITLGPTHTVATLGNTATPIFTLLNSGSFNIAINREFLATLSGTPAPGSWWWYRANAQSASAMTALTDNLTSAKTLTEDAPSGLKVGIGKVLTGFSGLLIAYKPLGALNSVTAGLGAIDKETAGAIVIAPGNLIALLAPAAGTTHVVQASLDLTKIEVSA